MTTHVVSPEVFRGRAAAAFAFLESNGFARTPADELVASTGASVVFAGRQVGFVIALDARDGVVDVRVARTRNGRLAGPGPDGYSANLVRHLVEHAGYRGRGPLAGTEAPRDEASLERVLAGWADFVRTEGGVLLADDAESLPG